eukprot:TRINITY_DN1493_c1_g1_i2.p1 TRINITY_DN1493_c1_g1~~TRINITY_DN1493_c1_g1_i2.p1  ORF type:complete len:318 (-),score=26.69 TRINITY_DN1493_c1_g1_i2:280-1233(-)
MCLFLLYFTFSFGSLCFATWDPQGRRLLSLGGDERIVVWDAVEGSMIRACKVHRDVCLSCTWLSNGCGFLSGGKDKQLIHYNADGDVMSQWSMNRVNDMLVSSNNRILITLMEESHINFHRISYHRARNTSEEEEENVGDVQCSSSSLSFKELAIALEEKEQDDSKPSKLVMSICLSRNDQYLLVALKTHTLHLWAVGKLLALISEGITSESELRPELPTSPVMHYHASERDTRFQLKGMFGGYQERFVILGGEDCKIYIWHRDSGKLLATLFEHSGPVNCVSWNRANPFLAASSSDDKTVNIWAAEALLDQDHKVY